MSQTPQLTPYTSHQHRDGRGLLTSRMYASRVGSCLIFVQRTATNCTSSFSMPEPRRSPLSWSSFWQGRERAAGLLAALPPCPGTAVPPHYHGHRFPVAFGRDGGQPQHTASPVAPPAPRQAPQRGSHLHRSVHVEVVQERVLHLAQHPAEEEEDLLPHPGGILGGRWGEATVRAQLPVSVPDYPVIAPNCLLGHPAVSVGGLQEHSQQRPWFCSPKMMEMGPWTPQSSHLPQAPLPLAIRD